YTITDELDDIGIAVKSNRPSKEPTALREQIEKLQQYFTEFRDRHRKPENIEGIIILRKIMQAIDDVAERIYTLHHYTLYDKKRAKAFTLSDEYTKFITYPESGFKLLTDNLAIHSNIFR